MNKSKIEWCDYTWNPVTGCLNNCSYCYARKIGMRFQGHFKPTFHKDRLLQPFKEKKPSKIFVCSMADLFGDWIPKEWIDVIIHTAKMLPQHTFLFLTKNPKRYADFEFPQNCWLGETQTGGYVQMNMPHKKNIQFISIEPLLEEVKFSFSVRNLIEWIIVGGLTPKSVHTEKWVDDILTTARGYNIPVFLKSNLKYPYKLKEFPKICE